MFHPCILGKPQKALTHTARCAQVQSLLKLGLLQRAFETARDAGSRADVRLVAAEAGRRADSDIVATCTAYLQSDE
jgi:hypothetical protein